MLSLIRFSFSSTTTINIGVRNWDMERVIYKGIIARNTVSADPLFSGLGSCLILSVGLTCPSCFDYKIYDYYKKVNNKKKDL